ncbi:hypothetical protein SAV14893_082930 [Streptomyces avermitilis]|uniref:Uncharacterized protein n=1 Tax=Streptomyces avermitilis TaxID=33903 RepID=A0A4D4MAF9_STRAX|nr:hypothetical protein SAV14893_082930 [Streptomyces avermitilis]GDY70716.1 hypothetical protein SAV31267_002010 [Streptomyces avermitilis]
MLTLGALFGFFSGVSLLLLVVHAVSAAAVSRSAVMALVFMVPQGRVLLSGAMMPGPALLVPGMPDLRPVWGVIQQNTTAVNDGWVTDWIDTG